MATTSNMNIGDFVYKPFKPQNPGIILSVAPSNNPKLSDYWRVKVLWLNGETTEKTLPPYALQDFNALIEEHKKKLNTHEESLRKLKGLH